ncbi:MAG: FkbM family methyltransferase [Planctomycetota bacterium]
MRRLLKKLLLNVFGESIYKRIQFKYWVGKITSVKHQEPALLVAKQLFQTGDVVLDIGAHFGRYTVPLSTTVGPEGRIFSFEPVDSAFDMLSRVVNELQLKNVELFNSAMGDGDTKQQMVIPLKDGVEVQSRAALSMGTGDEVDLSSHSVQEVECETVDAFVNRKNLSKLNFLKCDVEGAEILVMKGGSNTLRELAPIVLLEIESRHTGKFGYTPDEMVEFMKNQGYEVYVVSAGKLAAVDKPSPGENNYFFVPTGFERRTADVFA